MQGVYAWLRHHPWLADGGLALLLLATTADEWTGDPLIEVVSLLLALTVIPRRRYPVAAFSVALAIGVAQVAFGLHRGAQPPIGSLQPSAADLAIAVLLYTLARYRPRPVSVTGLAACLLLSAVAIDRWTPAYRVRPSEWLFGAALALGGTALAAWVLGDSVASREQRSYTDGLEATAARLAAERDAQAQIAAAAERARELQERRARAVDDSAARLRSIERDLHDGAQVRLAALAMTIGEIKEYLDTTADGAGDGSRVRRMAGAAHQNAKETLAELRQLARGIHPAVLDRGLRAALASLAEASSVPATLRVDISRRPSPAIEAIAYFCTAELLANAAKHSGAANVTISVGGEDGDLLMTVTDDGVGGAHLSAGGGLAGLRERVQTVDGQLAVDSPAGGPTIATIRLPRHA